MNPSSEPCLIVLAGPTAVGKTALSIQLAQELACEIVSCDSRQVYRELRIGVARPSRTELEQIPHHLIATHSIHDPFTAADYASEAAKILGTQFKSRPFAILTGGTGLFIRALIQGLDPQPESSPERRGELNKVLHEVGIEGLQAILLDLNPDSKVDMQNPQRVIRAIEIAEGATVSTGIPPLPYRSILFYLDMDRKELYKRIDQRVDRMFEEGLLEEARALYPLRELNALKTVGYTELFLHFDGIYGLEQAKEKIKQHSRNYAKRQMTWFRNQGFTPIPAATDKAMRQIREQLESTT